MLSIFIIIFGVIKLSLFTSLFGIISVTCGIGLLILSFVEKGTYDKLQLSILKFVISKDGISIVNNKNEMRVLHKDQVSDLIISECDHIENSLCLKINQLESNRTFELIKISSSEPKVKDALIFLAESVTELWNRE